MTVLLVLFTLILLLVADYFVQRKKQRQLAEVVLKPIEQMTPAQWHIADEIGIAPNHVWLRRESDNTVVVGLDNVLMGVTGIPERIILPKAGDTIQERQTAVVLRDKSRTLRLQLPLGGTVRAVNAALLSSPALAKSHPYSDGWLMKLTTSDAKAIPGMTRSGERATAWLKEQAQMMKEFLTSHGPHLQFAAMQDGGQLVDGVLKGFDASLWREFQEKFIALPAVNAGEGEHHA